MKRPWILALGAALVVSGVTLRPARADEGPGCASCPPAPTYQVVRRCGPIRRLLGWCCRPCYAPPVVRVAPVYLPPPCASCAGQAPALPPTGAFPGPGGSGSPPPPGPSGYEPGAPLTPQAVPPPVSGSSLRPHRPLAPVQGERLTPPQAPPPVRLERIVSQPGGRGPVQAIPATWVRTPSPE